MSTLANQLVLAERQDIARGVRLLLGRPLITERADPSAFALIRRRQDPLTTWFDYHCGWQLVVEPRLGYARLFKIRAVPDGSRPARRPRSGRAPFDRRRYTLLCVVAAELLPVPVTTVGLIADRVVQACATDGALPPFDTASRAERMAFVDVLKLLEHYGALLTLDGVTETFADSADAKVLYRVDATVLTRLPAAPVGPSRLAVPAEDVPLHFEELLRGIVREGRYGGADASDAQRNLRLRHAVLRRLFDDPVLHHDELRPDELAYLTSPTGRQIVRRAAEQGGFVLEERADGLLLVDPDGLATDSRFPDDSATARVAALLLLEPLTAAPGGLTPEQLGVEVDGLLRRFPRWAKSYQSEDGAQRLTADALRVLDDFGLAGRIGDRTVPRPAAFRYRTTVTDGPAT
ncbi:TIGR02678 family protein [Kitasatospora sp. NPDC048365]|uniref:TIGR02678 family protein n=1 Tax=Kitasatospora sp. NPDC048365 TaxID=3364050 RepID=UPI00371DBB57